VLCDFARLAENAFPTVSAGLIQLTSKALCHAKTERIAPCLGRALSDSNSSINYFDFSVFSVIWGICFSLKANPNGMKRSDTGTLLAQGTRLLCEVPLVNPLVSLDRNIVART
jgi:hypothetical protein